MATASRRLAEPHVPESSRTALGRFGRISRRAWQTVWLLVFLLAAIRAFLPFWIKDYANRTLSKIPSYRARIADVDLHLWRGAYSIQGLDIVKTDGKVPVPFFSAPNIDLSIEWRQLFHRALVGEVIIDRPKLNFVAGPTEESSQKRVDSSWKDRVKELFPVNINRFEIRNGEVHYRDFHSKPQVDVSLDRLHVVARNLTNSSQVSKTLVATIDAEGYPNYGGRLHAHADLDPFRDHPTFDFAGKLEGVDLRKFNDFLKAYGNFDVQGGTLDFYTEVAAADGRFRGYVKPLVENLDVFDLNEQADSFLQKVWEGVVGLVAAAFRNHPRDRFGTVVSFTGNFDDPQWSLWDVIGEVLHNTFIRALPKGLDRSIGVEEEAQPGGAAGHGAVTIVEEGQEKESTGGGRGKDVKGSAAAKLEAQDGGQRGESATRNDDGEASEPRTDDEKPDEKNPANGDHEHGSAKPGVLGSE